MSVFQNLEWENIQVCVRQGLQSFSLDASLKTDTFFKRDFWVLSL